jgi:hypothetical protein
MSSLTGTDKLRASVSFMPSPFGEKNASGMVSPTTGLMVFTMMFSSEASLKFNALSVALIR